MKISYQLFFTRLPSAPDEYFLLTKGENDCIIVFIKSDDRKDTVMFFDELKIGMVADIAPAVIEKEKMLSFARTYDHIPLHTDEEYAKSTPFGALIAPGVMSFMSVWANYLDVSFYGEALLAGKSTKIEWIKPVYVDDVLTGRATITNLVKRNAKNGLVELTIEAYNQNGELVLKDVTEAIVKCRGV